MIRPAFLGLLPCPAHTPGAGPPIWPGHRRERPQDPAGVSRRDDAGGDVSGHHGACRNHRAAADGDAGAHHGIAADPHAVPDGDGPAELQTGVPDLRRGGVSGGVETDPGTEKNMAADGDGGHIQKDTVVIGVEIVADGDLAAVVTAEGGLDPAAFPHAVQQLPQNGCTAVLVPGAGLVVFPGQCLCPDMGFHKSLIIGPVQPAGEHAFLFCHGIAPFL